MSLNRVGAINDGQTSTRIDIDNNKPTWKDLIDKETESNELLSVTCHAYSTNNRETDDQTKVCPCGRLARCHSFDGLEKMQDANATFSRKFVTKQKLTVYGQLNNGAQASRNISHTTFAHFTGPRAPITLNYDEGKTLDKNHSHFLLLDNGRVNCYIDDRPRSDFVKSACTEFKCQAITIIVEGGFNTLEVIKHDLMAERPVIIIHGSGRLANVLGTLLENSNEETIPEEKDVKEQLESVFHEHWSKIEENKENVRNDIIKTIRELFKQEYRKYLSVFYLEHDPSLTDTIFKAVDAAHADARQQENFLKLAISWNYADRAESVLKHLADDPKLYPSLFEQALKENRPVFVDYFLRRNHSPLQTTEFLKHSESLRMTISNGNESDSDRYVDIAFVLLLQLESRMGAALIAAGMAQHLSLSASTLDVRHTYTEQAEKYEAYATDCINACYKHNERLACQLLLRENPLFGNVTCMQIAIASRIIKFINTDCFNQVLNRQWFGHLPGNATESSIAKLKFLLSLISLGLIKHRLRKYRAEDVIDQTSQEIFQKNDSHRWKGIEDQTIKSPNYLQKVFYFHLAPVVKMCYDFAIYIWFLLVFSYMMLFHMNIEENSVHWTRIYLIITVSAMLIEDFRKLAVDYYTRMLERWHRPGIWMIPIYAMPYLLFYIGIILYFRSENQSNLFTAARIILAIDLELWYLFSLRFVSAIKLLGPKLFMIRNMLGYLTAFIYIIFVCIAAYGVVSRALTMYAELEFTARSIFTAVFYQPYWFLYSIVEEEKSNLDYIISNATSSERVAEATVTHVLLACHMLFINILILNLLIAVFNFSINEVHDKNEYIWRYQRYELIREYFEKPLFAFPPLSLLAYIGWFISAVICRGTTFRFSQLYLERRCNTPEMNVRWTEFENAATYDYARKFVEDNYRPKAEYQTLKLETQVNAMKNTIDRLQTQIDALNRSNEQARAENNAQMNRMMICMDWIMTAMARVRMSNIPLPTFENSTDSTA
ncbi:unnamed protein product [Rotaria sordida]|uniref:Transient receptor potential cation channel subfamily M member 3 n=1 Tax=Rotaria sordida TaxID=392033 RepID=A0A814GTW2_9BILA|nr:unnamed protein product [Rotaria sordida]CAF1564026.1 unnamed protein product [Rotaria sordida]